MNMTITMCKKIILSIVTTYLVYAINTSYLDDLNIREMMSNMVKVILCTK